MKPVSIHAERVFLRPILPEDAEVIASICQDPDIQEWTTIPSPYTLQDARSFISHTQQWWKEDRPTWIIEVGGSASGVVAGVVSFHDPVIPGLRAEVGYWSNPATRTRGYVAEALAAMIEWGFTEGKLGAIGWASAIHDGRINHSSVRVAQKCGFVFEGLRRRALTNKDKLYDGLFATILPEDPREDTAPWHRLDNGEEI